MPAIEPALVFPSFLADQPSSEAEEGWAPLRPGVRVRWLYRTDENGPSAALLRYEPGATVPLHEHLGYEHILVLRGSQRDERGHYPSGTLVVNRPGSSHTVTSDDGCVVLIVWERGVRFLDALPARQPASPASPALT